MVLDTLENLERYASLNPLFADVVDFLKKNDKMIDIQIPLNCTEIMGYTPRTKLPAETYNPVKDITFYNGPAEQYIKVEPGMFAIFFPEDGHAPCISDEKEIKKVIFKVLA